MIDLRTILSALYADRTYEQMESFLSDYKLLEPLKKTISQLNELISKQNELRRQVSVLPVAHIASNLLFRVNETIASEKNVDQKKLLETTLSALCLQILKMFIGKIQHDKEKIVLHIDYAFKDTCSFFNYDYNQLQAFLNLKSANAYHYSLKNSEVYKPSLAACVPSYKWQGKNFRKEEFLQLLKDQDLVESKRGLQHLFGSPKERLQISFNPERADLTLQLFHNLKDKKIVRYTGCKGFYQVLEYHVLDFKENILRNKTPRERINALKQSPVKWKHHQQFVDAWLKGFLDN